MINATQQRTSMLESQVMTSDVTDRRILRAMGSVPRERFVAPAYATVAYMDEAVPLAAAGSPSRALMAPRVIAKLLQLAEFGEKDRVLDVGAGTGYSAALLSQIVKSVVALESDAGLAEAMRQILRSLAATNVSVATGGLMEGWAAESPYDVIVLGGAIGVRPQALLDQLKDGGRLVAVVNENGLGKGTIWRRLGRSFDRWAAFDAAAPALPGFEPAPQFAL